MPGMDGYETAQIIRNRDQTKGIPIVFLSAVNKEAEHLLRGYAMGAVDYVFKPVDPIVLRSKVAVFVDLFAKTKEVERKARQEQALLDANLRANAERLRAEQELRRAEQRQAAIIQSLPMVLYLEAYEASRRVPTLCQRRSSKRSPASRSTTLPASPTSGPSGFIQTTATGSIAAIEARRKSGRSSIEYRWQCADGSYKHFLDQAVLLKDADGRPVEFAGTLTDISEQRSLESQLIQAQKMDAIGKLTGGIAHDFNNLLAAVIGGLGLIEKRAELADDQRTHPGMTKRAAEQGSELVRRLLAFARRQKLEPHAVDLATLQEAVWDLLTHTLGGLVNIEWKAGERAVWNAFADQAQLELALVNLIINARDAMPAGGTVTVAVENQALPADELGRLAAGDYVRARRSPTPAPGLPPTISKKSWSPSSRPRRWARAAALASAWSMASPSNRTARSG